jgi:hypothetical protein
VGEYQDEEFQNPKDLLPQDQKKASPLISLANQKSRGLWMGEKEDA